MADHKPGAHLVGLIRSTIPPIHPGGRPIVLGAAAGTVGARFLLRAVGLKRAGRAVGRIGLAATAASPPRSSGPRSGSGRSPTAWSSPRPTVWCR